MAKGRGGVAKDVGALPGTFGGATRPLVLGQGPWGHGQTVEAQPGAQPKPLGRGQGLGSAAKGRKGASLGVGAPAGVVGAKSRPWGAVRGRRGAASGRGGVTTTVRVRPRAVDARPSPWGRGQDRRGTDRGRGAQPKPLGHGQGPWGTAKAVGAQPGAVGARLKP